MQVPVLGPKYQKKHFWGILQKLFSIYFCKRLKKYMFDFFIFSTSRTKMLDRNYRSSSTCQFMRLSSGFLKKAFIGSMDRRKKWADSRSNFYMAPFDIKISRVSNNRQFDRERLWGFFIGAKSRLMICSWFKNQMHELVINFNSHGDTLWRPFISISSCHLLTF